MLPSEMSEDEASVEPEAVADAEGDAQTNDDAPIPVNLVSSADAEATLGALTESQETWARAQGFKGSLGQAVMLPDEDGQIDSVLFGWGDAQSRKRDRFHLGDFARRAPAGTYQISNELGADDAEEAALGWLLGRYRFTRYKSAGDEIAADLLAPDGVDPARLIRMVEGVFITRDLINTPASDMGPAALAAAAQKIGQRHTAEVKITEGPDLLEANLPLIHTVGRAAVDAPRLIDLSWGKADAPKVTLVGKGVCFDTGGLNLKPTGSMALMKKDMGGAATVLGLAHMIMSLSLPVNLRVLIPAVENAVAGPAFRPGDVLTSRLGKTVEINNTDAEGRLVLADALALAVEDKPELMIDMATLTGAARVALGPEVVPFYTDDEDLAADLTKASAAAADPMWRMPLWPGYERDIEPDVADLDNAPKGGMAGSITAALFLRRFAGDVPWAHFDIYGWTPAARPGRPKGGECQAARAILRMLEGRYGK
ncbi:MAG: leucyl aminopeptidase family protein [Pseudomonadota bacterium]